MSTSQSQRLDLKTLGLSGIHLVEASAGTGKTFNITRLFVRALLEKGLTVREILVVTYTEAATQELRGRIGAYVTELVRRWSERSPENDFESWLFGRFNADQAQVQLSAAAQDMDLAEIHTIHGFCARVLREQAFQSGEPFDQEVITDGSRLTLEAARDYFRVCAADDERYKRLHRLWQTPEACAKALGKAIENPLIGLPDASRFDLPQASELAAVLSEMERAIQAVLEVYAERKTPPKVAIKFSDWLQRVKEALDAWMANQGELDAGLLLHLHDLALIPPKAGNSAFNALWKEGEPLYTLDRWMRSAVQAERATALFEAVTWIRERVETLRRQKNVLDFSAMIHRVYEAVVTQSDSALREALADRYPVMLVDEFQDTDPAQFGIFHTLACARPDNALFMIGDPKQAIYSFRGGDVHTYLRAREQAQHTWTLDGNWRSTPAMVKACNSIFSHQANVFGDSDIRFDPVRAQKTADELGHLEDGQGDAALWIPVLTAPEHLREVDAKTGELKSPKQSLVKRMTIHWCAREARRLLECVRLREGEGDGDGARPLRGRDIAFLVRSHDQADETIRALEAVGLTAANARSDRSVLESKDAIHLRLFLRGVLHAEQVSHFLTALATPWCGLDAGTLYRLKEQADEWQTWFERFVNWREMWQRGRLLALLHEVFFNAYKLPRPPSHRSLTNVFHLAELMQKTALERPDPEDQLAWLEAAMVNPKQVAEGGELRLERDDDVITVMTMHGAKGLEFPIVFLPFADYPESGSKDEWVVQSQGDGLQLEHKDWGDNEARAKQSENEESMRLLYVALTRSIHRCYVPWLRKDGGVGPSPVLRALAPNDAEALTCLKAMAKEAPDAMLVTEPIEVNPDADVAVLLAPKGQGTESTVEFLARDFKGQIDREWRVLSFTALARGMQAPERLAQPERDEDDLTDASTHERLPLRFRMVPGAQTGEILHTLLEHAEFTQPDWPALIATWTQGVGLDEADKPELAQWLDEVLDTPMTLSDDAVRLRDLPTEHTLREADFFFPVHAPVRRIERALASWRGGGAVHLSLDRVEGMMRGFIDLIFVSGGRYWVADYKSTWLGAALEDYTPEAIAQNMQAHHYDLQGLIYVLALHRLLRRRMAHYDPARHLGGMVYLYLRGMSPKSTTGIYVRSVPPDVLETWDELFAGEAADAPK